MIVIPAIDIKEGKCVRLREGRMSEETIFSDDPSSVAIKWFEEGAEFIHIVDLDGAIKGKPTNKKMILSIIKTLPGKSVQLGGGIRSYEEAKIYLESGVERIVIGTKAVTDPNLVSKICSEFPERVVLAVDVLDGYVKTQGWVEETAIKPKDLLRRYNHYPFAAVVYTDISRDGMMSGVNIEATFDFASDSKFPVIASGGVSSLEQIKSLSEVSNQVSISGVICGRSLYEGAFTLKEAIETAGHD